MMLAIVLAGSILSGSQVAGAGTEPSCDTGPGPWLGGSLQVEERTDQPGADRTADSRTPCLFV